MIFNDLYDGYLALAEKGYCPVFIPTSTGVSAAVIAPRPHQLDSIELRPSKWLFESCRAVRNMAVENGYQVKG